MVSILWATMSARSTGHRSRAFLSRNVVGTPARSDALQAPCTLKGKGRAGILSPLVFFNPSLTHAGTHTQGGADSRENGDQRLDNRFPDSSLVAHNQSVLKVR